MTDKPTTANDHSDTIIDKSYETAISELEIILTALENNDIPLEQAIKQFEQGVALVNHCQGILNQTEQKIQGLTASSEEKRQAFK